MASKIYGKIIKWKKNGSRLNLSIEGTLCNTNTILLTQTLMLRKDLFFKDVNGFYIFLYKIHFCETTTSNIVIGLWIKRANQLKAFNGALQKSAKVLNAEKKLKVIIEK